MEKLFGELVSVKTEGGIELPGFLSTSGGRTTRLWVQTHGRGGSFFSGFATFLKPLVKAVQGSGWDFLGVSDTGGGYYRIWDVFESCVDDYAAWLDFARDRGYRQMVLAGHSYGPLKITYYYQQQLPPEVKGLAWLAPTDTYGLWKLQVHDRATEFQQLARRMVDEGQGKRLMPADAYYKPISATSYNSLYGPATKINIFGFTEQNFERSFLRELDLPILVIMGGKDEYNKDLDVSSKLEILKASLQSPTCVEIPGADHVFAGEGKALAREVGSWLKGLG
jgi:pimeloyl-ACP methyl ester carboxylesterase